MKKTVGKQFIQVNDDVKIKVLKNGRKRVKNDTKWLFVTR